MSDSIEALDHNRRRMLGGLIGGFVAWQAPHTTADLFPGQVDPWLLTIGSVVGILGLLKFLFFAWRMTLLRRRLAGDPTLKAALNDERHLQVRMRAFMIGFWTVLAYLVLMGLLANAGWTPPLAAAMQLGIFIGAVTPAGVYLWLERRADDDA